MNIAEEAGFCANLSLFDTMVCNCLLKSVSNELRDAPCPDCVSADLSWTDDQHEPLPWDRSEPLLTPPGSPVSRQTSDGQTPDSTSDRQTLHTSQEHPCDSSSSKCISVTDDIQHRKPACSGGECSSSSSRSKFLCYPLLLPSRRRISFSKQQVEEFERLFRKTIYPDAPILQEVAEKTGVSTTRLKTWFANKRSRLKKERSKMQLENKDIPKSPPCKCRCKIRLPPLKKQDITSSSVDNYNTSRLYMDVDGHHLASKRGLVNSGCSCARTKFGKEVNDVNPSPHVSAVNLHCTSNTRTVSTADSSKQLNSSGILPLNVNISPLLMPSVITSSMTCSSSVTSLSYSVNPSHPPVSSFEVLLTAAFYSPQYAAPRSLCQGFVTHTDQTVPGLLTTNQDNSCNLLKEDVVKLGDTLRNKPTGILPTANNIQSLVVDPFNSKTLDDHDHHGKAFAEGNHSDASCSSNVDIQQNDIRTDCLSETGEISVSNQIHVPASVQYCADNMLQNVTVNSSTEKTASASEMVAGENKSTHTLLKCDAPLHHQAENVLNNDNLQTTQLNCEARDHSDSPQIVDINNNVLKNDITVPDNNSFLNNRFQKGECDNAQKQTNQKCFVNKNCENIHLTKQVNHLCANSALHCDVQGQNLPHVISVPVINPAFTQHVQPGIQILMNNVTSLPHTLPLNSLSSGASVSTDGQQCGSNITFQPASPVTPHIFQQAHLCLANSQVLNPIQVNAMLPNGTVLPGYQILAPTPFVNTDATKNVANYSNLTGSNVTFLSTDLTKS